MPKLNIPPGYLTIAQAAEVAHMNKFTLRHHIDKGHLPFQKIGEGTPHCYRIISREALDAFLQKINEDGHLYEIICIVLGETTVLFTTRSLRELSFMYTYMMEHDNKLVRIRKDGEVLLIHESDKLGYAYHPRTKKRKGVQHGESMERGEGGAAGDLSGHDEGRVLHGEKPNILRGGAGGPSKADRGDRGPQAREPQEPLPAVPQSRKGAVQDDSEPAGRSERAGVPARPGPRRRLTDEERRLRALERQRRWRHAHPEKMKERYRRDYARNREKKIQRAKEYRRTHPEWAKNYAREYKRRKKEEAKNDPATKSE